VFKSEGEAVKEVKSGRERERERERDEGEALSVMFLSFLRFVRGDEFDVLAAISSYKCLVT
jgi:hypothetical protein